MYQDVTPKRDGGVLKRMIKPGDPEIGKAPLGASVPHTSSARDTTRRATADSRRLARPAWQVWLPRSTLTAISSAAA